MGAAFNRFIAIDLVPLFNPIMIYSSPSIHFGFVASVGIGRLHGSLSWPAGDLRTRPGVGGSAAAAAIGGRCCRERRRHCLGAEPLIDGGDVSAVALPVICFNFRGKRTYYRSH
jgi:hypothetical protein